MRPMSFVVWCLLILSAVNSRARGQCAAWIVGPDQGVPGVNGTVFASTTWDPDGDGPDEPLLVVGGTFSLAGTVATRNVAAWDGSTWRPFATTGPAEVHSLAVHEGQLYAGDATSNSRVWRWTGQAWLSIGQCNGAVEAMTSHAGSLVVAGMFSSINSMTVNGIARWNGTVWQSYGTGMANTGFVFGVGVFNGDLIATGNFTTAGGVNAANIARWNGTAWSALGSGLNGNGHELIEYDGSLIVGGTFSAAGGMTNARRVARWNGTAWSALNTGVGGTSPTETVRGLAVLGNDLVVSGQFSDGGTSRQNAARWNGAGWSPMSLGGPSNTTTFAHTVRVYRGDVFAGGLSIETPHVGTLGVARWNGAGWEPLGSGLDAIPNVFGEHHGRLVMGGPFASVGATPATGIAAWNGSSWTAFENGIGTGPEGAPAERYGQVNSLLTNGDDLYVGGAFEYAGGFAANSIARWDGAAWRPLGTGMGTIGRIVLSLTMFQGDLIAGGSFSTAGGLTVNGIARWDGSAWHPIGDGFSGPVRAVAVFDGHLYAGGGFTQSGPNPLPYLARWDGAAWQPVGSGLSGGEVNAMIVHNGELHVGGRFSHAGGIRVNGLARWNGSELAAMPSLLPFEARVSYLASNEDGLYVSGTFTVATYRTVARWDGAAWHSVADQPSVAGAIGLFGREVLLGAVGIQAPIDGHRVSYLLGRWSETGIPWLAEHPESASVALGGEVTFAVTPASGYEALTFEWEHDGQVVMDGAGGASPAGGVVSGAASATLTLSGVQPSDAGEYVCRITNTCGEVISETAVLTLACRGDFNHDGLLSSQDFFDFISAFFDLDTAADFNDDGFVNSQDFFDFIAELFAGC